MRPTYEHLVPIVRECFARCDGLPSQDAVRLMIEKTITRYTSEHWSNVPYDAWMDQWMDRNITASITMRAPHQPYDKRILMFLVCRFFQHIYIGDERDLSVCTNDAFCAYEARQCLHVGVRTDPMIKVLMHLTMDMYGSM